MISQTFTLLSLLAFSSAGLLEVTPNPPSRLYLPVTPSQQINNVVRTSQPVHLPTIQVPLVPTVSQVPVTRSTTGTQHVTSTINTNIPVHTVHVPHDVSSLSQQVPATTLTASTGTVNTAVRTSQPAQIQTVIPTVVTSASQQVPISQIAIVRLANENVGDGTYSYNYETENGIAAEEHGQAGITGTESVERVHGSYSYTGPDNVRYTINYVADENGYRAEGAHLPVPPTPVEETSQVTTGTAHITNNVVNTRSSVTGVHVVPTTITSQPLQIVQRIYQTPGVQVQRHDASVQTSYQQQTPTTFTTGQNILRQTVVPSDTVTVQQSNTDYTTQQSGVTNVQSQHQGVLERQSTVVPSSSVTVQEGSTDNTSHHVATGVSSVPAQQVLQRHTVVPHSTVQVGQGIGYTTQHTSGSVQQGTSGYTTQLSRASGTGLRQNLLFPSSIATVQHGNTGYTTQQTGVDAVHAQQAVVQRQASVVPVQTVTVQQGNTGYTSKSSGVSGTVQQGTLRQTTVVPSNTVTVQHGTTGYSTQTHQTDVGAVQAQQAIVQRQASVVPVQTVTVQQGNTGYTSQSSGISGTVQQGSLRQTTVVPSNTVTVQHGTTGYSTQTHQTDLGAVQAQQEVVQRQASIVPANSVTIQQGLSGYNNQQADFSSVQSQHGAVESQRTVVPSPVTVKQSVPTQYAVSGTVQQGVVQSTVPSAIVTINQGRTGLINQRVATTSQHDTVHQGTGVSSSTVTVRLGTSGYSTQQVGDSSTVQILDGVLPQNVAAPTHTLNVQQVALQSALQSQQVPQSQTLVPTNTVTEQRSTSQQTTVSHEGVVLPDGTVHHGYQY